MYFDTMHPPISPLWKCINVFTWDRIVALFLQWNIALIWCRSYIYMQNHAKCGRIAHRVGGKGAMPYNPHFNRFNQLLFLVFSWFIMPLLTNIVQGSITQIQYNKHSMQNMVLDAHKTINYSWRSICFSGNESPFWKCNLWVFRHSRNAVKYRTQRERKRVECICLPLKWFSFTHYSTHTLTHSPKQC